MEELSGLSSDPVILEDSLIDMHAVTQAQSNNSGQPAPGSASITGNASSNRIFGIRESPHAVN